MSAGHTSTVHHATERGAYHLGDSAELLGGNLHEELRGRVNLLLTSPPFPLNQKKSYGNRTGDEYKEWFVGLADLFADLLTPDGSIVIELGNAWEPGRPVQSLLTLESLLGFVNRDGVGLRLIQEVICYNPARLPSPAVWVTRERVRLTDSYTRVWWIAKSDEPKADNRKVLRPYSKAMKRLLERQSYNAGRRPSEAHISDTSFLTDNGGAISHNVLEVEPMDADREPRLPFVFDEVSPQAIAHNALALGNTGSNDHYHRVCRERGITPHPARMPLGLAAFFIRLLTDPGDLVVDPFAGSNTTGYAAERLERSWLSFELRAAYAEQAEIRMEDPALQNVSVV